MTSPSSPVDSIAKAPTGLHETVITHLGASFDAGQHPAWVRVEQDGNGVHGGFYTCAAATEISPAYIRADIAADIVRQAEAMKREMAEKDARIAALEAALKPFSAHQTADGIDGPGSLLHIPDEHPLLFNGLGSDLHVTVTVGDVRRARALIGGGNAED